MNKAILVLFLFVPVLLLAQYKGTYETQKIREVWFMCFTSLSQQRPDVNKNKHAETCDCYADNLRVKYTWEEFLLLDGPSQYKETYKITTECLNKLNPNRRHTYGRLQPFALPRKT